MEAVDEESDSVATENDDDSGLSTFGGPLTASPPAPPAPNESHDVDSIDDVLHSSSSLVDGSLFESIDIDLDEC